jgi:hypothetical protein
MAEDIYRVKDELLRMVYDHDWGGYEKGLAAGKNFARNQILQYIDQHLQEEVAITVEDVASEIEYIQRREIREKNG